MRRVILCLGMHRSGTSLVAKALECLGARLGPRAEWNGPDNPYGFYEDRDILALNEAVLRSIGSSWDSPEPFTFRDHMPGQHVMRALLRDRLAQFPIWAVKEPRLCRLLPLWRPPLAALSCEVSVVHVVRHPMAVAKSLEKRNGTPIDVGLQLWLEYTRRARLDIVPEWPAVTVLYDAMIALPRQQIQRIGASLGLREDSALAHQFAITFVDDTLWHNTDDDDAVLPLEVSTVWQMARKEALR